jgi:aryl-alcohol dehydrogenase-like predicted oxidoreductase
MSLGTAQLGMNYGIANQEGKPGRLKSFAILDAALDAGITALDTARAYGDSEEVLGAFFDRNPKSKEKLFITTKLSSGLPPGSPASKIEKKLVQSVETSLSNLGCAKVNCLLLHNAADLRDHGTVVSRTLGRMVDEGMADMAGVSVMYHPEEVELLLKTDVYQAVQLPMSILDQRFLKAGVLDRLRERGIRIFVRSVFFQGLLFLDPENIDDPDLIDSALPHIKTLRRLCEKAGMSMVQLAIAFLRDLPGITSMVLGADNPKQVIENCALFEGPPLDDSLRHEAEAFFKDLDYTGIMKVLSRPKR